MKDEELRGRWREETGAPIPGRDGCPSPEVLLDLAERGLDAHSGRHASGADESEVLLHLARCSTCREDLAAAGALLRAARGEEEAQAPVPGSTRSGALRNAVEPRSPKSRRRSSMALAASVVLAVGIGVLVRWVVPGGADGPVLRGGEDDILAAVATCSEAGIVELRWAPVPGAERYRVEIFTDFGDLVMAEQVVVTTARLLLPSGSPPEGTALLHVVEAELTGGTILTSPATALPPGCFRPR